MSRIIPYVVGFPDPFTCGTGTIREWLEAIAPMLQDQDADQVRRNALDLWIYQLNFYSTSLSEIAPNPYAPQSRSHGLPRTLRLVEGSGAAGAIVSRNVGMAHYRLGKYLEALASLTRAAELRSETSNPPHPAELAYLAMTQFKLDKGDQAAATLAQLRDLMMQDWPATPAAATWRSEETELRQLTEPEHRRLETDEAKTLLGESEALIEGRSAEPGSAAASQPASQPTLDSRGTAEE